jgi:transposase
VSVFSVRQLKLTQQAAADRFQVSVSTVKVWLKRASLLPNKPGPKDSHRLNRQQLQELIKQEPDAYLDELAEKLNSKRSTVAYNLSMLKISRKKNHAVRRTK